MSQAARRADREAPSARSLLRRRSGGAGVSRPTRRHLARAKPRPAGQAASVTDLPGFGGGRWWVQDLAASLPARLIPAGGQRSARPLRGTGWQDDAACGGRPPGHRSRRVEKSSRTTSRESRSHASRGRADACRCVGLESDAASSTQSCSMHPARRPARSGVIPKCSTELARASSLRAPSFKQAARTRDRLAQAGSVARLFGLLARAAGRRRGRLGVHRRASRHRHRSAEEGELPDFVEPSPEGWVRILPGLLEDQGGLDGFFMVRLVRRAVNV